MCWLVMFEIDRDAAKSLVEYLFKHGEQFLVESVEFVSGSKKAVIHVKKDDVSRFMGFAERCRFSNIYGQCEGMFFVLREECGTGCPYVAQENDALPIVQA